MAVFDCFPFFNEIEVLELRLHELADVVDHFVLVEATMTHAGQAHELVFDPADERWAPWREQIVHVVVDDFPARLNAWGRENFQRLAILRGLDRHGPDAQPLCGPLDLVIVSDVDEIPRAETVMALRDGLIAGVAGIEMHLFRYHVNQRAYVPDADDRDGAPSGEWMNWNRARAARRYDMPSPQVMRDLLGHELPTVKNGGWHLSFLGGTERMLTKIAAYAHQEFNVPPIANPAQIAAAVEAGNDIAGQNDIHRFATVPLDTTYPRHLLAHPERYAHLVKGGEAAFAAVAPPPRHNPQTWMPDVWEWLTANYRPTSVLELGCGDGANLGWFAERGIATLGVDRALSPNAPGPGRVAIHDFATGPWQPPRPFDLCLCTDLVGRLAPEQEGNLTSALAGCGGVLLAHPLPGEGGDPWGRTSEHWVGLMERAGFAHVAAASEGLRKTFEWHPEAPLRQSLLWFLRSEVSKGPGWPGGRPG